MTLLPNWIVMTICSEWNRVSDARHACSWRARCTTLAEEGSDCSRAVKASREPLLVSGAGVLPVGPLYGAESVLCKSFKMRQLASLYNDEPAFPTKVWLICHI